MISTFTQAVNDITTSNVDYKNIKSVNINVLTLRFTDQCDPRRSIFKYSELLTLHTIIIINIIIFIIFIYLIFYGDLARLSSLSGCLRDVTLITRQSEHPRVRVYAHTSYSISYMYYLYLFKLMLSY